jgi:hypothetical protein
VLLVAFSELEPELEEEDSDFEPDEEEPAEESDFEPLLSLDELEEDSLLFSFSRARRLVP